jgi:hypothetical protein
LGRASKKGDRARELKKVPTPGCGVRRGASRRVLRGAIQRAGCGTMTPRSRAVNCHAMREGKPTNEKGGPKPPRDRSRYSSRADVMDIWFDGIGNALWH